MSFSLVMLDSDSICYAHNSQNHLANSTVFNNGTHKSKRN